MLCPLPDPADDPEQILRRQPTFQKKVRHPQGPRLLFRGLRRPPGEDDHGSLRVDPPDLPQHLDAVHLRHDDVEQDQGDFAGQRFGRFCFIEDAEDPGGGDDLLRPRSPGATRKSKPWLALLACRSNSNVRHA